MTDTDTINRKSLEQEFDLEDTEIQIQTFREKLDEAKKIESPSNLLTTIIDKAGRILDIVETEMVNGSVSGKMVESAANILNVLMLTTNSMVSNRSIEINDGFKRDQIEQNNRRLDQRDEEIRIKELYYNNKKLEDSSTTNNVLLTDRESILKFLENKGDTKKLEGR